MFKIVSMNRNNFYYYKPIVTRLIKSHKDGHITAKGFQSFLKLNREDIQHQHNAVIIALHKNKVVGMLACADQGRKLAITVVHGDYRKHGLGKRMLQEVIKQCGGFYCEAAADNLPSIKTCFACNMVATDAFLRYGKIILRMNTLNNVKMKESDAKGTNV